MSKEFLNREEIDALLQDQLLQDENQKEETSSKGEFDARKNTESPHRDFIPQESGINHKTRTQGADHRLELILDIPLNVSVVLGKTRKSIQEILSFQSGSIVELNRLVDEHVDILVNNVLVAKGEVVVINENFGVKITSILNPRERMLQLKGTV